MTVKSNYRRRNLGRRKLKERILFRLTKLAVMVSVFCLVVILFININNQKAAAAIEHPNNKTIVVESGDTLWKIARTYKGSKDTQRFIYELEKCNNLKAPVIYPGQSLILPTS